MKNIKALYVLSVLCSLLTSLYANAQDCSEVTGYSVSAYNSQMNTRLQAASNALNSTSIDLQPGNGSQPANYIILNDKDFYGQNTGGYGDVCQWEFIDAAYPTTSVDIDDITYFILTPGDYRDYLAFMPRFSNSTSSANDKKYLLYYPYTVPEDRELNSTEELILENYLNGTSETPKTAAEQTEYERAIIENFNFVEGGWSWVVRGITIRGNHNSRLDDENFILGTGGSSSYIISNDNIIESCLFENQVKGNFLNITNGSNNIIYDCVIRNQNDCMITYLGPNDIVGINIKAQGGTVAENNIMLNNEIYNVTDAIQLSINGSYIGAMPGTLIYGNEMYNEKVYVDNCGEERMNGEGAIDIKQGAAENINENVTIDKKVIIANNLFYGWRRAGTEGLEREFDERTEDCVDLETHPQEGNCFHAQNGMGGGGGEAVLCHFSANNIAIINNTVSDCSNGFYIGAGKQIEIYKNTICNLYPSSFEYVTNSEYWINTVYDEENVWTVNASNEYIIPACIENFDGTYRINHRIGEAIRSSTPSCIVQDNNISGVIRGIHLNGFLAKKATVKNNYISDIYTEDFYYGEDSNPNDDNPDDTCIYANFSGNTYYNFTDLCWGGNNYPPANKVIQNNSFLNCNGCKMNTRSFSCEVNCN